MKQESDPISEISKACSDAERELDRLDAATMSERKDFTPIDSEISEAPNEISVNQWNDESKHHQDQGQGVGLVLLVLVILGFVAVPYLSNNSASDNNSNEVYATINEFNDAIRLADDAVLLAEHQTAISKLEAVIASGIDPSSSNMNINRLRQKINSAKKAMRYLNQEGRAKYWESSSYGYQWFNKHDSNAYKVFFAYSKKCKDPQITFEYSRGSDGPVLGTTKIIPRAFTSTLRVPYRYGNNVWLGLSRFRCN